MDIIRTVAEMQARAKTLRAAGRRIGFVPTMGYLHAGHLSLVELARHEADVVVVSIFVNPTQFGPNEDLSKYPRDFERDERLCRAAGVDIIFYPESSEMYAPDATVYVTEDSLSRTLCGASRPGHFRGVCTVVAKLFNIVLPAVAVFGRKDAQQLRIIRQMTRDLNFPVKILPGPILRGPDGLAMSSRNIFLSSAERRQALCLKQALNAAGRLYSAGERNASRLQTAMREVIATAPAARIDYIEIVDADTLQPVSVLEHPALVALAVFIGKTRLIDNCTLPPGG